MTAFNSFVQMIHEINEDYSKALDLYQDIRNDFKESRESDGIEKYISRVAGR